MPEDQVRILSKNDIRSCVTMAEAVGLMRSAFAQLSDGTAVAPLRTSIAVPGTSGRVLVMPVALPDTAMFAVKVVSIYKDNPKRGLPTIFGMMMLSDAETGRPLALMDAEFITALRTGAASGLATDLLAPQDANVVTIIGAGAQGRTQLAGVCAARQIHQAYVVDPNPHKAAAFADDLSATLKISVVPASLRNSLPGSDIVCTATTSTTPVFEDRDLKSRVHINAVGAYHPEMCEVPASTVQRASVIVDSKSACLAEAGDIVQPLKAGMIGADHVFAEIGELIAGIRSLSGIKSTVTLFKSVGNAVQDLAVAAHVFEQARSRNLGTILKL